MIEISDPERAQRQLRSRLLWAGVFVMLLFGVLLLRFVWLQVLRHEDFQAQAEDNRIAVVPVAPARGLILDRKGTVVAENVSAFTLELAPRRIADLERTIDELSSLIEIGPRERRRFRRLMEDHRGAEWLPLKTRLSDEEVARVAAHRYRFEGVDVRARPFRSYPQGQTGAHVVGYIGRISQEDKRRLDDAGEASRYAGATHMGKIGIEQSYEAVLRGESGIERVEVSAGGKVVRSLSRVPARVGANVVLSVDMTLQRLVEQWFGDRRGALVAIEPATGEVLAFVSVPTYDPNLFVDGIDTATWKSLNEDPDTPLLNRPLRGTYPPGSTYKPFMALAVLDSGVRGPATVINDPGYFMLGTHKFRDSNPSGHGAVDLRKSIVVSSDTYYYGAALEMGVDRIHDYMKPWGFGQLTGIDLAHEATGILPSSQWKMKRYKQKWLPGETPSIGIGQGYNNFTILQLAHATAILANRGQVMRPRLVRETQDPVTGQKTPTPLNRGQDITIPPQHLALVQQGMIEVNRIGTGRLAFAGADYVAAGKTGTAQVIGIRQDQKYDARRIAERYRDHSLFMAYAPAEAPRVALAVIVENGGFGAQAAAPIARKVFDYLLLGKVTNDLPGAAAGAMANETELRDVPEAPESDLGGATERLAPPANRQDAPR
ncbi:MAG: penicillin-binding protein 2 [Burkholderiaceae bacterium]